jgi:hypothetical protein
MGFESPAIKTESLLMGGGPYLLSPSARRREALSEPPQRRNTINLNFLFRIPYIFKSYRLISLISHSLIFISLYSQFLSLVCYKSLIKTGRHKRAPLAKSLSVPRGAELTNNIFSYLFYSLILLSLLKLEIIKMPYIPSFSRFLTTTKNNYF